MTPCGIDVVTANDGKGNIAVATVNWVTQTAFSPSSIVLGVKVDPGVYAAVVADNKISGQTYRKGETGAPVLVDALRVVEYRVSVIVEQGDRDIMVGGVVQAILERRVSGRPDRATLENRDLGEVVLYGG